VSALDPANTTMGDLVNEALKECGRVGLGQVATGDDFDGAWMRLQWMLQQWEKKRWLVYHLVTKLVTSTGVRSYSVGPGGDIDTGAGTSRPDKIESAFLRQLVNSQPDQIDYPLGLLQSMEDYNTIGLKGLVSFPSWAFYDPSWPLGQLFPWPVPQAVTYAVGITLKAPLPIRFLNQAAVFSIPYEYYSAMLYNLALRLRPKFRIETFAGDMLPGLAKDSLAVLRGANTAIARLRIPAELNRDGIYNIFSDRSY
jgi:hypothetical protein